MNRIIIDTREPYEFQGSHVDGAINIPPQKFMQPNLPAELSAVDKDQEIIVYCRSGQRSNTVGQILRSHGFSNIVNGVNEGHVTKLLKESHD